MNQLKTQNLNHSASSFHALPVYEPGCLDRLIRKWSTAAPRESRLATGQIIEALFASPAGLSKRDLVKESIPDLSDRSERFVMSLENAFQKRIQRARKRIQPFGLDILYCRDNGRWRLVASQWATPVA
jgi:hypothetical protein